MEEKQSPSPATTTDPLLPVMELIRGESVEAICARYAISREELEKRLDEFQQSRRRMALQQTLTPQRVGRNEPCPCGSGRKYKKCCLSLHEEARRSMPPEEVRQMEEQAKNKERLGKDVQKGFDLLFKRDYLGAQRLTERLLDTYPDDDRLHDIAVTAWLATGDYDSAFYRCRARWQVSEEEKTHFQEYGFHQREGAERKQLVYFYTPSTWLEKFWIAQRAREQQKAFPRGEDSRLTKLAAELETANDLRRFPAQQQQGYEMRRKALASTIEELQAAGPAAIPYLLPLTYVFSWASLFVPELLHACGTDAAIRLLAEFSMFRFPFFAQECLRYLEQAGERALPAVRELLQESRAFDELKGGLIMVLGKLHGPEIIELLGGLVDHENPYVVKWVAQALENQTVPEAQPLIEKAQEKLRTHSQLVDAIQDMVGKKEL